MKTRIEKDSIGELKIPSSVLYGIQSYRASKNFPISGTQVHIELIRSYLLLKKAAAKANLKVGSLDAKRARAIVKAVDSLLRQDFTKHFIVDAYQAGAGTSQNMNVNEVIANLANLGLGKALGTYSPVHPNDHVNQSQSTNDTYPTAMRLAVLTLSKNLEVELKNLEISFKKKSKEFKSVIKAARTHLQDAVPMYLGQEFAAYGSTISKLQKLLSQSQVELRELGIGGSAAGTGLNVPRGYQQAIVKELQVLFQDRKLRGAADLCEAMQSQLSILVYSNFLRASALELTRIFNDLRLLSSGPSNGLSEIFLPATQPGSSIMPGKVNPSILEMANQVCFKVLGNDVAVSYAMQAGQMELNVMMPLMAQATLESTHILTQALKSVRKNCVDGITANTVQCRKAAERTSALATALNPVIGYARAAELVKESLRTEKTIVQLVREKKLLSEKQIRKLLLR